MAFFRLDTLPRPAKAIIELPHARLVWVWGFLLAGGSPLAWVPLLIRITARWSRASPARMGPSSPDKHHPGPMPQAGSGMTDCA